MKSDNETRIKSINELDDLVESVSFTPAKIRLLYCILNYNYGM